METHMNQFATKSHHVMMSLNLNQKKLLVVGGGPVAYKRFNQWIGRGGEVHVVALEFSREFEVYQSAYEAQCKKGLEMEYGKVILHERAFVEGDLEGVWMVYVATRDEALNNSIEKLCREKGILWGRGDLSSSEIQSVAMIESESIQIGISTNGKAPALVSSIKEKIESVLILEELEAHIDLMQKLKLRLKTEMPDQAQRAQFLRRAVKMSSEELEILLKMSHLT